MAAPGIALAEEEAAELAALGKEAYRKRKYDDAFAAFEAAYDADPLPKYLYNLGKCQPCGPTLVCASGLCDEADGV